MHGKPPAFPSVRVPAEVFKPLDPMANDDAAKQSQIDEIRAVIIEFKSSGNLVMMTDRANIIVSDGDYPAPD